MAKSGSVAAGSGAPASDRVGFDAAYRANAPDLIRMAFLLTGSNAAAEDAVHAVFVRLAYRLDDLEHPASYLRTCVVNECRTQHRRSTRFVYEQDEVAVESFPHEVIETLDALSVLGEQQRAAVVLRYFVDVPDDEIAQILDCAPATVRSLVHRAIKTLREELS